MESWRALHEHYKRYAECDDGDVAEGYSEAVMTLFAKSWDRLPDLDMLSREDNKFLPSS